MAIRGQCEGYWRHRNILYIDSINVKIFVEHFDLLFFFLNESYEVFINVFDLSKNQFLVLLGVFCLFFPLITDLFIILLEVYFSVLVNPMMQFGV